MLGQFRHVILAAGVAALLTLDSGAQELPGNDADDTLARLQAVAGSIQNAPDWEVRRIPNPIAAEGYLELYRAEDVKVDLQTLKTNLDKAVGGNQVLRTYISTVFPSGAGFSGGSAVIQKRDADGVWARAVEIVKALGTLNSLSVDLEVVSRPRDGAVVRLSAVGLEDEIRETTTTGTLSRVWRGLYRYQIWLDGELHWEGRLDLVQERGSRLVCIQATQTAAPVPCRLEAN